MACSPAIVTITADDTNPTGVTIPADFISLSFEIAGAVVYCHQFARVGPFLVDTNTPLINAMQLLYSAPRIRIQGASSEIICENSSAVPTKLTQADFDRVGAFRTASGGGHVRWGLTLRQQYTGPPSSLDDAIEQVGWALGAFGASNVTFQLSTEPNVALSTQHAIFAGLLDFATDLSDYSPRWTTWFNAITAEHPTAVFSGPDTVFVEGYVLNLFHNAVGVSNLTAMTNHDYTQSNSDLGVYITRSTPDANVRDYRAISAAAALSPNMIESGQRGDPTITKGLVGGSVAAAYYMSLAVDGWAQANAHTALWRPVTDYTPIDQETPGGAITAFPRFLGLMLVARMSNATVVSHTATDTCGQVKSFATKNVSDNKTRILVTNPFVGRNLTVVFDRVTSWTSAELLRLVGDSPSSQTATLGGANVAADGTWAGQPEIIVPSQQVQLPPCGAAMVTFDA